MNTNTGITSTYAPNPTFFRRKQSRKVSISSFNSIDSLEDSSDESSSSSSQSSSSSLSSARSSFSHPRPIKSNSLSSSPSFLSTSPLPHFTLPESTPLKRIHLKLSLALIQTRSALSTSSYDQLLNSLKSLASALPSDLTTLGLFIPILERLGSDLILLLGGEGNDLGRAYRKSLSKLDAKALIVLKQRWTGNMKGKGKEIEGGDWYTSVKSMVTMNESPSFFSRPYSKATSALLSGLESILLPTSLPKLVLSELELDSLSNWIVLERCEEVLEWYLSFDHNYQFGQGKKILGGIKSLDLSKNRLNDLPLFLSDLLPSLETLSLSHNQFRTLPINITLLPHLRRLKTHGNQLRRGTRQNAKEVARIVRSRWSDYLDDERNSSKRIESLSNIVTMVLRKESKIKLVKNLKVDSPAESDSDSEDDSSLLDSEELNSKLPLHLQLLLSNSYSCVSCHRFIPSSSNYYLPPLFERVHHLDPGVSIPTYLVPPPPLIRSPSSNDFDSATLPSPSSSPARPPHLLSIEEKVFIALLGRGADLATYIIGDSIGGGGSGKYSFCFNCAEKHLGLNLPREDNDFITTTSDTKNQNCQCLVCVEEKKVRVKGYGINTVMRWLRRRPGTKT